MILLCTRIRESPRNRGESLELPLNRAFKRCQRRDSGSAPSTNMLVQAETVPIVRRPIAEASAWSQTSPLPGT
jgi:hypothetical protein